MIPHSPLGAYVHWPYCARICPYCDFNVCKNTDIDATAWINALTTELKYWADRTEHRPLTSLYFGGGTPSLAPVSVIKAVIETCDSLWGFIPGAEITLETNPTDAEADKFKAFAQAGVNRLSLGVQSLRDEALDFLGRNHSAGEARSAIDLAQNIFPRTTFDLIYARPKQSLDDWEAELTEALATGIRHLSLYQLTIEDGTAFHRQVEAKRWVPADEDACADQFALAQDLTTAVDLRAYETSNHAAPGHASAHNLLYWRYQDYIGVGPGAQGRLNTAQGKIATQTVLSPKDYLAAVSKTCTGIASTEILDDDAQLTERLSMGLRLVEGIPLYADDVFYNDDARVEKLTSLIAEEFLHHDCGRLTLTNKGRPVLNRILYELLA